MIVSFSFVAYVLSLWQAGALVICYGFHTPFLTITFVTIFVTMEENAGIWILQLLGRLHPLTVHFPIGLLVVALFLEGLTLQGKRPGLREGINCPEDFHQLS